MVYLKPVLPAMAEEVERFLKIQPLQWADFETRLVDHEIARFTPLMKRVESEGIQAMIADSQETLESAQPAQAVAANAVDVEPIAAEISIEDFCQNRFAHCPGDCSEHR